MVNGGKVPMLEGYKVVDFTQVVSGPMITQMMAEMGADIVKIELAPGGDNTRKSAVIKDGQSGYFVQHNRGKKSLCLDMKTPEAREIVAGLIRNADVLVENFTPGAIGRLGFDYETVKGLNPSIIMCSVSAFGQKGPLALEPGFDPTVQAYTGAIDAVGPADGPPMMQNFAIGDVSTGVHALAAIACALLWRGKSGRGQYLDIALLDVWFNYYEVAVQRLSLTQGEVSLHRSGRLSTKFVPTGLFKGPQGYIQISAFMDSHWERLAKAMGRPEMAEDPRYKTLPARNENADAVHEAIEAWLATLPDDETAVRLLSESRTPAAPVLTLRQAVAHPHMRQRGTVRAIKDRVLGEFEVPGFPLRFSEFPDGLELQAPFLGEHNEQILTQELGYSVEQVRGLEAKGVLQRNARSAQAAE